MQSSAPIILTGRNSITTKRKENKMKALKVSTAIAATILFCALIASGCSNNPSDSQSGAGQTDETRNTVTAQSSKERTLLVSINMQAGEKYVPSASDFDQYGLIDFKSVSLEISDPRLPIYQPDHCSDVEIAVEYDGKLIYDKCSASNFSANEILLVNHSEMTLYVEASVICNIVDPMSSK